MSDIYLLRAADIAAMPDVTTTHRFNPAATRSEKNLGDKTGLKGMGVHITEVKPGQYTTAFHMHHGEDEAVYILEGTGTARIGTETRAIGPGDFIGYRKGGVPHDICNTGEDVLRLLVMGTRSAADVCDYPEASQRLYIHKGVPNTYVALDAMPK